MEKSHYARSSVHSMQISIKSHNKSYYRSSSAVSSSASISDKIKEYGELKQIRPISQNNFAIYLVFSEKAFEYLVMKIYPTKDGQPSNAFQRASRINNVWHENIIQIVDVKFKNKSKDLRNYLVSELAPYGNFDALLRKRTILGDEVLVRTYFHQLINALDYLHSRGLSHMNLNPGHMLLGTNYKLKLCGFSNLCTEELLRQQFQGTKNFRSPQLKNFVAETPLQTDIYAAGIILFVMYTGMLPYKEDLNHEDLDLWSLMRDSENLYWNGFHDIQSQIIVDDPHFRSLFSMMTRYDHEKRATINDIRANAWYRGTTYSDKKVAEIMKNKYKVHPITHSPSKLDRN